MFHEAKTMKSFHLGDILTVTTGYLVAPRGVEAYYDILNYMTGDVVFTHQVPRVMDECKPFLLSQFPQLANIDASQVNPDNWKAWLAELVEKHGKTFEVKPIPKTAHTGRNPVEEVVEMVGGSEKVTAIIL